MKTKLLDEGTNNQKCSFCGKYDEVKFIKVSPKKEKPACLTCYKIMKPKNQLIISSSIEVKKKWLPCYMYPGHPLYWGNPNVVNCPVHGENTTSECPDCRSYKMKPNNIKG